MRAANTDTIGSSALLGAVEWPSTETDDVTAPDSIQTLVSPPSRAHTTPLTAMILLCGQLESGVLPVCDASFNATMSLELARVPEPAMMIRPPSTTFCIDETAEEALFEILIRPPRRNPVLHAILHGTSEA